MMHRLSNKELEACAEGIIMMDDIRTSTLLGFETALQASVEEWRLRYNIHISLSIQLPNELKFENDEGKHLYQVIQEAVDYAVNDGKATAITIEVYMVDNEVYFQIVNNGQSRYLERLREDSVGIMHMQERIKLLQGDINWISEGKRLTRVEGYIPIIIRH